MANVSVPQPRGAIMPREVVMEKIQAVLTRHPDLMSFDPLDEKYEKTLMCLKLDPGCPREERDGWTGEVADWYFGPYTITDERTGELITMPSLVLMALDGRMVRLSNSEPAVRSWLAILREIGVERVKKGINVRVSLRKSAQAVGPYWQIMPA